VTWLTTVGSDRSGCGDLLADEVPATGVGMRSGAADGVMGAVAYRQLEGFPQPESVEEAFGIG